MNNRRVATTALRQPLGNVMVALAGFLPDRDAIKADLAYMTRRWGEIDIPCMFELRSFADGTEPRWAQFTQARLEESVTWAYEQNVEGRNVYVVRNPIALSHKGSATDVSIVAAFFCWADCDDHDATNNVRRFDGPKWTAAITTGRIPETRVHIYWELEEPVRNLDAWRRMQVNIAAHFHSDPVVINPSRIMRVGGTISYPPARKLARGYTVEVCTLRTTYDDEREPVAFERLMRVFGDKAPEPRTDSDFNIDIGPQPLDRERTRIQALSGQEWHDSVIRLVGSYVSKGLSDEEIHDLTDPLTLSGYTVEQTRKEVQTAIEGARRKGWAPEYAKPEQIDFDTPSGDSETEGLLEWFDDVEPSLSDNYLVKDVLGGGAMSVVYGPSNSGKTFLALDIAFHVAIDVPWHRHRVKRSAVLYLAAEGGRGIANRVVALKAETGCCDVPLALRRAGLDLLKSNADLKQVVGLVEEIRTKYPVLPILIVIDTLSRVMAGGDENSPADMTAFIRNVDAIRSRTQAHVMIVHHSGKDTARGARGHSSLRAATDTEIEVANEEGSRAALVTKQRDYEGGQTFAFSLKSIPLGIDQDGDEVTSCVVEWQDSEEFKAARKASKGRGKNQAIIMEAFDQMVSEGLAKGNPGGVGMPDPGRFWTVGIAELRRISQGKMSGDNTAKLFRVAWDGLTARDGLFVTGNNVCWRVDRRKS